MRRYKGTLSLLLLVASLGLRAWTSDRLPTPALAVKAPGLLAQATAQDDGVHLLGLLDRSSRPPSVEFGRATYLGNAGYQHGFVVNLLGLKAVLLSRTFNGGDYSVPPHAAIVFSYWLLIVLFGSAFVRPFGRFRQCCHFSRCSLAAMATVSLLLVFLNCIPSAWRTGAVIRPSDLAGWAALISDPSSYPEICLQYGFPFVCFERGFIGGKSVDPFYGYDSLGWHEHKLMENACLVIAATVGTGIAVEWFRGRSTRKSIGPHQSLD